MMTAVFIMIMLIPVIMVLVIMAVLILILSVVMMMVMMVLLLFTGCQHLVEQLLLKVMIALDGIEHGPAVQLSQRCRNDDRAAVVLPQKRHRLLNLLPGCPVCSGKQDGAGIFNLIQEEFAEIPDIHSRLCGIHDGNRTVQLHIGAGRGIVHRPHDIGQLSHAGGLDQDPLRVVLLHHFLERSAKISDERAADAPRVHLTDFDAGLLQKSAVDADFAELIFNQDNLRARERFLQQLLDQGSLAGSKETGHNVDLCLCHFHTSRRTCRGLFEPEPLQRRADCPSPHAAAKISTYKSAPARGSH